MSSDAACEKVSTIYLPHREHNVLGYVIDLPNKMSCILTVHKQTCPIVQWCLKYTISIRSISWVYPNWEAERDSKRFDITKYPTFIVQT